MPRSPFGAVMLAFAVMACSTPTEGPRAPREIRSGAAAQASQYVEPNVSPDEVASAIRAMIAAEPVCMSWPTLWLERTGGRTIFLVRYDLMARDWGAHIAAASTERMQEFVEMGFLTRRERADIGPGAIEYQLTPAGERALDGSPYSGERPTFCAPAQRRLVAITNMEWGDFSCGNLRVHFSHTSDDWPTWARAEATRTRLAAQWPPIGTEAQGTVTLSRQWFAERDRPRGVQNGALGSVCYDQNRTRVVGDDLVLFAATPQ